MTTKKFTEEDIRDYAHGKFSGDILEFENFLQESEEAYNKVKEFRSLYNVLHHEEFSFSFNLSERVIAKLQQKEYAQTTKQFRLLPYMLTILAITAIILTSHHWGLIKNFSSLLNNGAFIVAASVMIIFVAGFSLIELKTKAKRFAL